MKLRFSILISVALLTIQASADIEKAALEKKILKDFIAVYNSSKTPFELRQKLLTLKGVSPNQAAYLFGEDYFKPLPRLSYDLEKMQLGMGGISITFTDLGEGEAKINGKPYKYDLKASFTRNYVNLLNLYRSKTSARLPRLFISEAYAGTAFPVYEEAYVMSEFTPNFVMKQRTGTKILRETKGDNGPDKDLYSGIDRVIENPAKAAATTAMGVGTMLGSLPLVAALPIHYGVVNAHAYLVAPSCEKQAVEIAESLNKDSMSMAAVNCVGYANFTENSSITFWKKDGSSEQLFANWDTQEAWTHPDQLMKFDDKKLTEVRELHYTDPAKDSINDRLGVLNTELHVLKEGDGRFEGIKKRVEPMRKILEIFGRNQSCMRCEQYFKENLALKSPSRYDIAALKQKAGIADSVPTKSGKSSQ